MKFRLADIVGGAAASLDKRLSEDMRRTDERAENTAKERIAKRKERDAKDAEFDAAMTSYAEQIQAAMGPGYSETDAVRIIKDYGGNLAGAERAAKAFTESQDAGINVIGNYIFGLPYDTHETMQDTLDFALENPTEMANFYSAMAYPGSPLHKEARKNKIVLPETYAGYSQHSYETQNLSNDYLKASEILEFRDYSWDTYHSHPGYLSLMRYKFGQKAVDELENTKKVKLKRKLLGD